MTTEAVEKPSLEIIPVVDLGGLPQSLSVLAGETAKLAPLKQKADAIIAIPLPSWDGATCQQAKLLQAEVRAIKKASSQNLDRFWYVVAKARDFLSQKYNEHDQLADAIDESLGDKVKAYDQDERRRAKEQEESENRQRLEAAQKQAEQERKDRERKAEDDRKKKVAEIKAAQKAGHLGAREAARMLKEAGAAEDAAIAQAEADAEAKVQFVKDNPVTVQPVIPKVAGVPARKNYKVEVTNFDAILSAFILAISPGKEMNLGRAAYLRRFIMVNEQALGAEARLVKNPKLLNSTIPGIRAYED